MKFKFITMAFALIFLIGLASASLCQNINPLNTIPCQIVTPVLYCSGNASIFNLNTSMLYTNPTYPLGDGTYQFDFTYGIGEYQIILCDDTSTTLSVTSAGTSSLPTYYPTTTTNAGNAITFTSNSLNVSVGFSQYPYVDLNTTENLYVTIINGSGIVNNLNVTLYLTELNNSVTAIPVYFSVPYHLYTVGLIFDTAGDYPVRIDVNGSIINQTLTRGTLLVRKPYYVKVKLFNDGSLTAYENNAGVITAEFKGNQKIDGNLENFFHPIAVGSVYYKPSFHANYINGQANLKLYDDNNYLLRFYSGQVRFDSSYSVANITKFSGENVYLGEQRLTNSSDGTTLQYILSQKDLHAYTWLLNWILIITFGVIVIGCIALFFAFPEKAQIALIFGFLFTFILVGARLVVYIWLGQ